MPDIYKRQRFFYSQSLFYLLMAMFITQASVVYAQPPSQEFWEYMEEYDDGSGELLDPLEYDEILEMKNNSDEYNQFNELSTLEQNDIHIVNPNRKFAKKSSAQTSSKTAKGAAL